MWGLNNSRVPNQRFSTGKIKYERWGWKGGSRRALRDLRVLPDHVSGPAYSLLNKHDAVTNSDILQIAYDEEWWRIEAWRRLDPRITYEDISMRQRPKTGTRTKDPRDDKARLRNRFETHREAFCVLNWKTVGKNTPSAVTDRIRARFTLQQIHNNSSRGVTPGLIDLSKGEVPGNRVPLLSIKDLPGVSSPSHRVKRLRQWHTAPEPVTPERPRKRVKVTTRRSARLQEIPSQNLSSPVRAFEDLTIESTNNTPRRVIKGIKDKGKPTGNDGSKLDPRHILREAKDNDGAEPSSGSEGDPDSKEIAEFEESVVVHSLLSSEDESSPEDREISEYEVESEYEDYEVPELSQAAPALEIEDSEPGIPGPVEEEGWGDNLPSIRTTPGRSIDLQDDPMNAEAGRLDVLSRFMSYEPDIEEQDHTAEENVPVTDTAQVERHLGDSSVQPSSIPKAQTTTVQGPIPDALTSGQLPENRASNGLLESLVKELSQLRNAVAHLAPSETQSADLIANKVDRLARISLDMQTGAAMLVDEIAALRAEVHRLGG